MFNSETLGFSNPESSPETLNENATNQQRGEMVNQAAAVQGETSQNDFASMSLKDLMNVDPNNLSDTDLIAYIEQMANEANKAAAREQAQQAPETPQVLETPQAPEATISPEEVNATVEKTKNNSSAKGFLSKKAMAAIVATSLLAGGTIGYFAANTQQSSAEPTDNQVRAEQQIENDFESLTGYDKLDRMIDGSFEQDGNLGCYESDGKVSQNAVGNPNLVLEELGIDPATATPEQRGAVSEYMAYSMKYPAAFDAVALGAPGFEGLSINEAEDKIESMTDEEKENLQKFLQKSYENSEYHTETGQGLYENHGVLDEGGDRHSIAVESDLTGVEVLVRETKLEDGSIVRTIVKEDCNNPVFEIEITKPDGTITKITVIPTDEPTPEPTPVPPAPTGSEGTGSEGTGNEGTGSEGTGDEGTKEKDVENTKRIDNKIDTEIENDVDTKDIKHNPNPGVTEDQKTDKPSGDEYKGTEPQVVQNNDSKPAEKVDVKKDENNYSENKGGAHSNEYAPVKENNEAQKKADASETKVKDAPTSDQAVDDALNDLGIN
ncbi:hypothetical protein IJG12_03480 [Candidatus Saccharibacteria bacterium]|nr:hypothetical protein [Candidatus Saccharibacteria bacterium]